MKETHTATDTHLLMNQIIEVIEYVNNQRFFLIGKPGINLFNQLLCGYSDKNYHDLLQKKINKQTK